MNSGEPPSTLVYKQVDGHRLTMLRTLPPDWRPGDRRTAILFLHGGGWSGGEPAMFLKHSRTFAERGAACFCVKYRLIPRRDEARAEIEGSNAATVADCLADCKSAVRYLRHHAEELGIHPDRIVAVGDSAGGHLAAALGSIDEFDEPGEETGISSRVDAVVNGNGIPDLTGKWKGHLPDVGEAAPDEVGRWLAKHELARRLSPLHNARPGLPPQLIQHGLADTIVPPEEAVNYYEAYVAYGNVARLTLYPECNHAFLLYDYKASLEQTERAVSDIDDFLTELGLLSRKGKGEE